MKRLFSALLAALMFAGCVAMFASCAREIPNDDYDSAKEALEDAGYNVTASDRDLEPGEDKSIFACSEDYEEYVRIVWCEDVSYAKLLYDDLKFRHDREVSRLKHQIRHYEKYLDMYEDDMKNEEIDEYEDNIKELEDLLKKMEEDYVVGRKGKMVWVGTVKVIKATK